jgi:hypothetical protein
MATLEDLTYTIEAWSNDGNSLIEVLARTANQQIGVLAFRAARASRTTSRIRLRQRACIILDSAEPPKR